MLSCKSERLLTKPHQHVRVAYGTLPFVTDDTHLTLLNIISIKPVKVNSRYCGGEEGIRTLGTVTRTHAFQACAFNHSATSPYVVYDSKLSPSVRLSLRFTPLLRLLIAPKVNFQSISFVSTNHSATSPRNNYSILAESTACYPARSAAPESDVAFHAPQPG